MNRPKTPTNRMTFLQRLKYIVIQNLGNHQFGVEDLAREMGISHSQLHRLVRRDLHKTINEYIREIRLEEAMKLLKDEEYTAAEISYQVGFSSPAYFNKCFHDKYGFPPGEVKKLKQEGKLSNGV
ncbi:MAG: helix-turn-helix transcriptional regulator, partial [Cyclobacteriaceae bacterium]|nr:helix-turn-helix transcriptional regulator [Cyclobacteriaceae bacterium]